MTGWAATNTLREALDGDPVTDADADTALALVEAALDAAENYVSGDLGARDAEENQASLDALAAALRAVREGA